MTLMQRRRALMGAGTTETYLTGYTVIGSPSIADGIMTPSANSWITTPVEFNPGDKPWYLLFRVNRKSYSGYQNIISGSMMLQGNSYELKIYLKSVNSSSYDIAYGVSNAVHTGWKWIKISFDGSVYRCGVSEDGISYANNSISSALLIKPDKISFGAKASNTSAVLAEYDLTNMGIWIGNKLWWKAM